MKRLIFLTTLLSSIVLSASLTAFIQADDDATQAKNRKASENNLRQLLIAMHNYHGDYGTMPAHAMYDQGGTKPLLSWRVSILPYLDQIDLYKKFNHQEPWDSATNKALIKEMPGYFAVPGVKAEPGMTHYQVFTMPLPKAGAVTPAYMPLFSLSKSKLTLGQITVQDGTSNTICIAEATEPVIWTKPQDMLLENDNAPLPKLGIRPGTDEFQVVFVDGAVRQIRKKIDDMNLHTRLMKQMIGRRDGLNGDVEKIVKP